MRMALEVRSLSKNYGKVQALKNVSFKIGTGVYGLLGRSQRSGKVHNDPDHHRQYEGVVGRGTL